MASMNEVLSQVLKEIKPSKEELTNLEKTANEFISELKKNNITAYIGGSLAKGTITKSKRKQDIDIFVVFSSTEEIKKFENKIKKIKLPGKLNLVHGSRDYFRIDWENAVLEIVPVIENKDPNLAENVTDISLSHVKYLKKATKTNPKILDEIRLAKAFCRAQRVYGAESYIQGFSGYSLEILVNHFGSFIKFLKGIQKGKIIDPTKQFKNHNEIMRELNASKLQGPLILIDPTHKFRNVSAGLGFETFGKFVMSANQFLKSPSTKYFERQELDVQSLESLAKKKKAKLVELTLTTNKQEGDIAGTKMKKFLDFFHKELMRKQQKVITKEFDYNGKGKTAKGYLLIQENKTIEVKGPSTGLQDAVEKFKKARGKTAFKKGKYYWFKENVSIKSIFDKSKSIAKEMNVVANYKSL
ncbi:MAG: nucleotidyltransferase domain-containing protein [archaeon]|nr:nucleotidyltransferase domain-containing protein [archaeon]MCR4323682.1 nucleotidyltransferase domain-containing protein [Nanoarchaeota archaeon]